MNTKELLIRYGFQNIVEVLPFNFHYSNEASLRNPATLRRILTAFPKDARLELFYKYSNKFPISSILGRLFRDLLKMTQEDISSGKVKVNMGHTKLRYIVFPNTAASRVIKILEKEGIEYFCDMEYVSPLDCERLNLHERSRRVLVESLKYWDKDNVLERLEKSYEPYSGKI